MTCKNCGIECDGKYCPACGQRQKIKISLRYLFSVFLDAVELKKGLLYNIKMLTVNPGKAVHGYLSGKTKPYLNPITFLLMAFSIHLLGLSIESKSELSMTDQVYHQLGYITMVILSFLIPNYIVFLFKIYSFFQQFTAAVIFGAYFIIVSSITSFITYLGNFPSYQVGMFVIWVYFFYSYQSVLSRKPFFRILSLIISVLLSIIIYIGTDYLFDPFKYFDFSHS